MASKEARVDVAERGISPIEGSASGSSQGRPQLSRASTALAVIQTDDWWLWELAGIVISAGALGGICGLLSYLDDRPQPTWAYSTKTITVLGERVSAMTVAVSPNSILALLSTVCRLCILIPVTKGLAQMKWVWFAEQERPLSDFETFENATRGLTGSMFLMWKLKFRHFAVLGAVAVLLALVFDPFVQNLLSYYDRSMVDPTFPAALTKARTFGFNSVQHYLSPKMKGNIVAGFTNTPGYDIPPYFCGSGNCTWTDTTTLGVCSKCEDISSMLTRSCTRLSHSASGAKEHCTFTLPNRFILDSEVAFSGASIMNVTMNDGQGTGFDALVYGNYSSPIALIHAIYPDLSTMYNIGIDKTTTVYANECVMMPCVQKYNTSVGTSVNSLGVSTGSSFEDRVVDEYDLYDYITSPDYRNPGPGAYLKPADEQFGNKTYFMAKTDKTLLTEYLYSVVPGTAEQSKTEDAFYAATNGSSPAGDSFFLESVFNGSPFDLCNPSLHSMPTSESVRIRCGVENMAIGMSVAIRNGALLDDYSLSGLFPNAQLDKSSLAKLGNSPSVEYGKTMVSKTYIHVTWYWLALPVFLWFLAVIVFIGTVWKTRKAGVRTWRTNTLAPFFLNMGIGDEQRERVEQHPMTAEGLAKKAEEVKVQLHLNEQEARLVGG